MNKTKTGRIFLKGLLFSLPILLTFTILIWAIGAVDKLFAQPIKALAPEHFYFPGMGIAIALIVFYLIGLAIHGHVLNTVFRWTQLLLVKLPVINIVYQNLKEMIEFVSGEKGQEFEQTVLVSISDDIRVIGLVTQTETDVPQDEEDPVKAVYLPMSYQMGGYLVYVPESKLTRLSISKKEAMQRVLTADISGSSNFDEPKLKTA